MFVLIVFHLPESEQENQEYVRTFLKIFLGRTFEIGLFSVITCARAYFELNDHLMPKGGVRYEVDNCKCTNKTLALDDLIWLFIDWVLPYIVESASS